MLSHQYIISFCGLILQIHPYPSGLLRMISPVTEKDWRALHTSAQGACGPALWDLHVGNCSHWCGSWCWIMRAVFFGLRSFVGSGGKFLMEWANTKGKMLIVWCRTYRNNECDVFSPFFYIWKYLATHNYSNRGACADYYVRFDEKSISWEGPWAQINTSVYERILLYFILRKKWISWVYKD